MFVLKGREILRGVEMVPMHARSHWGPRSCYWMSALSAKSIIVAILGVLYLWQQLAEYLIALLPDVWA